jgi:biopolymer transport protein ExbB
MLANVVIDYFLKGGPIMYPILIVAIVAVCVVGERTFWWLRLNMRRDPETLEKVLAAMENGDFKAATVLAKDSEDPVVRMVWHGLNHYQHSSMQGALQVAAGIELQKAGRFLTVMDTLVTLAPLLGLLGTVTGLMRSFQAIGGEELAVQKITGGIGEALIATMCGLAIAIIALIPFNFFTGKTARLQFEMETAATNVEVMVNAARQRASETPAYSQESNETSG